MASKDKSTMQRAIAIIFLSVISAGAQGLEALTAQLHGMPNVYLHGKCLEGRPRWYWAEPERRYKFPKLVTDGVTLPPLKQQPPTVPSKEYQRWIDSGMRQPYGKQPEYVLAVPDHFYSRRLLSPKNEPVPGCPHANLDRRSLLDHLRDWK